MEYVIRADGGLEIGLGHLVRSTALARELRARDHTVTYATRTPVAATEVIPNDTDVFELTESDEQSELAGYVDRRDAAVVVDSYDIGTDYQRQIREVARTLAVVLDDIRHTIAADVLINGNLYAPSLEYDWEAPEPTWCLGTEYLLLRQEFRDLIRRNVPERTPPERALITMGGSDTHGVTPAVMRTFEGTSVRVDVIVGPGFENETEIRETASAVDATFDVVTDPPDLAERMFRADFAVSAVGTSTYELLAARTPFVGVPQADNQLPIARALADQDAALVLDKRADESAIATARRRVESNASLRNRLRTVARGLVSDGGPAAVADILEAPTE
jgi:UDP-2,4-diacetamido-2,4,6-trideoxy-beta-L-altropyranose hydrolase